MWRRWLRRLLWGAALLVATVVVGVLWLAWIGRDDLSQPDFARLKPSEVGRALEARIILDRRSALYAWELAALDAALARGEKGGPRGDPAFELPLSFAVLMGYARQCGIAPARLQPLFDTATLPGAQLIASALDRGRVRAAANPSICRPVAEWIGSIAAPS